MNIHNTLIKNISLLFRYQHFSVLCAAIILSSILAGCSTTTKTDNTKNNTITLTGDSSIDAPFTKALSMIKNSQFDSAETLLLDLTRSQAQLTGPHANLGIVHYKKGEYKKAEARFRTVLKLAPNNTIAYNYLGMTLRQLGRFEEAQQAYKSAIVTDPDYSYAHLNLGILYDLYMKEPANALVHYQQYQTLLESEDKKVSLWIKDLKHQTELAEKKSKEGAS
ncbi:MAG: tetratricopeptide repeat protein [Gammaproteobacteria bacterium]|nr:tetratricopeptide repeat protein [Gammaproteobacteria bacterium]